MRNARVQHEDMKVRDALSEVEAAEDAVGYWAYMKETTNRPDVDQQLKNALLRVEASKMLVSYKMAEARFIQANVDSADSYERERRILEALARRGRKTAGAKPETPTTQPSLKPVSGTTCTMPDVRQK
jgi:hypothetical protein